MLEVLKTYIDAVDEVYATILEENKEDKTALMVLYYQFEIELNKIKTLFNALISAGLITSRNKLELLVRLGSICISYDNLYFKTLEN